MRNLRSSNPTVIVCLENEKVKQATFHKAIVRGLIGYLGSCRHSHILRDRGWSKNSIGSAMKPSKMVSVPPTFATVAKASM
jgi:hypothetical protein